MDVFAALADPVRRDLLRRLAAGPARVADLAADHPQISRPAVSKHLRLLREAGLVDVDPVGRERPHRLLPAALAAVRSLVDELSVPEPRIGEHRLDALELEVRRTTRDRATAAPDTHEETG